MSNNKNIKLKSLKGKEINSRIIDLMNIKPLNENTSNSTVELTKEGPDGNIYAIIKENSTYFIKVSEKKSELIKEDFNYIGGLKNKTEQAYPSYAKALKKLNLKFISLNENFQQEINVFKNDSLLSESDESSKHIVDKKGQKLKYDAKVDNENHGDNIEDGSDFKDVVMSETEKMIDEMIIGEDVEVSKPKAAFSIERAINLMETIVEDEEGDLNEVLDKLNESEKNVILNALKKKD